MQSESMQAIGIYNDSDRIYAKHARMLIKRMSNVVALRPQNGREIIVIIIVFEH